MVKLQEIQFTRDNNKNIKQKKNYRNDRNVSCVSVCVCACELSSVYPGGNCYTELLCVAAAASVF